MGQTPRTGTVAWVAPGPNTSEYLRIHTECLCTNVRIHAGGEQFTCRIPHPKSEKTLCTQGVWCASGWLFPQREIGDDFAPSKRSSVHVECVFATTWLKSLCACSSPRAHAAHGAEARAGPRQACGEAAGCGEAGRAGDHQQRAEASLWRPGRPAGGAETVREGAAQK